MMYRRNKYNNKKTIVDNIKFDSMKEAEYYLLLRESLRRGDIKDLVLQPSFELLPKTDKTRKTTYKADFMYYDNKEKRTRIVDVKGHKTEVYKIKKKMLYALKGLWIEEV